MQENKCVPRNTTYSQVYNMALELFENDKDKTNSWWMNKCDEFGGLAPYEMVKHGKARKLIKLINRCR